MVGLQDHEAAPGELFSALDEAATELFEGHRPKLVQAGHDGR